MGEPLLGGNMGAILVYVRPMRLLCYQVCSLAQVASI
jgi:hypothetical protein